MGDLREEERQVPSPPSPSSSNPERWNRAEEATQKIVWQVQPTVLSEKRRREVIDYVERLIGGAIGCEVFPFGSVPLKTYLPDGDIDLTAFGGTNVEDALVNEVVSVLEAEYKNRAAEFIVKDVQLIWAEAMPHISVIFHGCRIHIPYQFFAFPPPVHSWNTELQMIELLFRLLNSVKLKEFPSLADEQLNHLRAIHLHDEFR
ncbi:hypothetical protein TEA_021287 [Camellia sinensis var. sinensis]|uniref:Polymerase nucleotidyl transferase domain-containing protein n=1 Tax=Camellia sinensis var. sinensis TaxID=542762 RepID=A0A4S4D3W6_CAMSN|nr:hypothetical protein TEA_021287 [Camellia sinensis var. sinensis]